MVIFLKAYLQLMRVHHYLKNLLIFAPLVFSRKLFQPSLLGRAVCGFVVMCLVSSAVYILNDIQDAEADRNHSAKCRRPIASGQISAVRGRILAVLLLSGGALLGIQLPPPGRSLPWIYLAVNLGYSLGLKHIPLADVFLLSSGFLLRLLYGGAVTGVPISGWLFLTVLALSLYFSLGKRRNECRQPNCAAARKVLARYPLSFLNSAMNLCLMLALVFYSLWSMDSAALYTVPLVLLIVLKYSLDLENGRSGDPVEILLEDKALQALCLLYVLTMFGVLYGPVGTDLQRLLFYG